MKFEDTMLTYCKLSGLTEKDVWKCIYQEAVRNNHVNIDIHWVHNMLIRWTDRLL